MAADYNKLVIFDCDGTLVDSQHMIVSAMHQTFDQAGIDRSEDLAIRRIIGLSLEEAISALKPSLDGKDLGDVVELYKSVFLKLRSEENFKPDPLFAGTLDAMLELEKRGYLLAVATGNSQRGMQRVIDQHQLHDKFISVQTADFHPSKPHPSMIFTAISDAGAHIDQTVMIGDTKYDTLMARNAGTKAVGVSWGYHSGQELLETGASALIDHYDQLPDIIDSLIKG